MIYVMDSTPFANIVKNNTIRTICSKVYDSVFGQKINQFIREIQKH